MSEDKKVFVSEQGRKALVNVAEWLEAGAPHKVLGNGLQVDTFDMTAPVVVYEGCGTSCCIAGAVCQFEGLGLTARNEDGDLDWFGEDGAKKLAGDFLGIREEDQDRLFEPWAHFVGDDDSFSYAQRGAAVLRHFLETGDVDWDRFNEDGTLYEEPTEEPAE